MNAFIKAIALPLFAVAIGGAAFSTAAQAQDAMNADTMADCMKRAGMETDAMKKQEIAAECSKMGATPADSMKPADAMAPAADPMKPADAMAPAAPKT